jgi:hypothetical protein
LNNLLVDIATFLFCRLECLKVFKLIMFKMLLR